MSNGYLYRRNSQCSCSLCCIQAYQERDGKVDHELKKYNKLVLEVIEFEDDDIITNSGDTNTPELGN